MSGVASFLKAHYVNVPLHGSMKMKAKQMFARNGAIDTKLKPTDEEKKGKKRGNFKNFC